MFEQCTRSYFGKIKKVLDVGAFIVLPLTLIVLSISMPEKDTFLLFGQVAQLLLIGILFIKPVSVILCIAWIRPFLAFRRQVGVALFWFALFHSIMFVYDRELYAFSDFVGFDNYLTYGLWAMVGMSILALTSNNYSLTRLKKNWKRLQYLAYPTLFLVLLHSSMAAGELQKFFVVCGIYSALKVLEWKGITVQQVNVHKIIAAFFAKK